MRDPMLAPVNDPSAMNELLAPVNAPLVAVPRATSASKRATICRLFGLLRRRELCMIFVATFCTLVASLLQMALPVLSGWLISAVSTEKGFDHGCKQSPSALSHCRRARRPSSNPSRDF